MYALLLTFFMHQNAAAAKPRRMLMDVVEVHEEPAQDLGRNYFGIQQDQKKNGKAGATKIKPLVNMNPRELKADVIRCLIEF